LGHTYAMVYIEGAKTGLKVRMLVDTGATYTIMPPSLGERLGIMKFPRKTKTILADKRVIECEFGTALVQIEDREAPVTVILLDCLEPLLGAEALEALGLKVNPETGQLESTRGYTVAALLYPYLRKIILQTIVYI